MKPFFTYYGGKWRAVPRYPQPECDTIVEPFAGAAGYAVRYPDRLVVLVELNPVIAGLWKYLVRVTSRDIRRLPISVEDVDCLNVCQEARWLIGFWLNKGNVRPVKAPGLWMRGGTAPNAYWGPAIRERIASQVDRIRHWRVIEGSYETAPSGRATWFIDPPYSKAGIVYPHGSERIDYASLGRWCRSRIGQVIVCEADGADWLPFKPLGSLQSTPGKRGKGQSQEAVWIGSSDGDLFDQVDALNGLGRC